MATLARRGSGTPATTGTTWASVTNAVDGTAGTNPATYATMTNATASAVATIEITGYSFSDTIGSETLNSVTVALRHFENNTGRFASVRFQPYDGATAIGSIFTATMATAARTDSTTFPVTNAQLRSSTFKIRVTITGAASTQSRIFSIDQVDVTADYTPNVALGAWGSWSGTASADVATLAVTQAAYRFYDDGAETGTLIDGYDETNRNTAISLQGTLLGKAQSFVGDGSKLGAAGFHLNKSGTPPGTIEARLYAHTGTFGASGGEPTGAPLAISATISANAPAVSPPAWFDFIFDGTYTLVNGTPYCMALFANAGDPSNCVFISADTTSPSHPGRYASYNGTSWASASDYDAIFRVYASNALAAQNTSIIGNLLNGDGFGQIRVMLQSTTAVAIPATDDWQLQYQKNGGTWTNVAVGSSNVRGYASTNLTDDAATTNRLTGGSGSFVAGKVSEDGLVDNLGWTANNYTELLYSVSLIAADFANGDVLNFRVLRNGATTGLTYTQTPTITIVAAVSGAGVGVWGEWTGTASATVEAGAATILGTGAGDWGAATATALATVERSAVGAGTWGALTATAEADVDHAASALGAWGALTGTASGGVAGVIVNGSALGAWGAATATAFGTTSRSATGAGAWGALTGTAAGQTTRTATGAGNWGSLTGSAVAAVTSPGTAVGFGHWGGWTATATGNVSKTGTGVGNWGTLTGTALGTTTRTATGTGTWGAWTGTASATVRPLVHGTGTGNWGALTATATSATSYPVLAVGAWGGWTATASSVGAVAASAVGLWGAWTATAVATVAGVKGTVGGTTYLVGWVDGTLELVGAAGGSVALVGAAGGSVVPVGAMDGTASSAGTVGGTAT